MTTREINGTQMLSLMETSGASLVRWDGGFWCLSQQPADFVFGDAPDCPWVGCVMLRQMINTGALIETDGGYKLPIKN